jgi:glycosyltransferase involved in cell wall biosynthesis
MAAIQEPYKTVVITCVMAAHNAASTIEASVESVLRQSFRDIELIVVDDGSTDETVKIIAGIDDERIVVLRQPRRGPSAARNYAIALSRGEYVAPIDADDIWLPRKLELQLEAIERSAGAAVAYGWTDFVDERLRPSHPDTRATFEGNVHEALLRQNFIACGSNTLMRLSAVEELGCFDETLHAAEDWELHTRLAARYPFVVVPEVVVLYRHSPLSITSHFLLMERHFLAACRKIFDAAPGHLRSLEVQQKSSFYRYLTMRAAQSKSTKGRWRAVPRYSLLAAWHDPRMFLKEAWRRASKLMTIWS